MHLTTHLDMSSLSQIGFVPLKPGFFPRFEVYLFCTRAMVMFQLPCKLVMWKNGSLSFWHTVVRQTAQGTDCYYFPVFSLPAHCFTHSHTPPVYSNKLVLYGVSNDSLTGRKLTNHLGFAEFCILYYHFGNNCLSLHTVYIFNFRCVF
jgi:hypothetical protein